MDRLPSGFLSLVLASLLSLVATSSQGGTFNPETSLLSARLGPLPAITLVGQGMSVASLATDGSSLTIPPDIWASSNFPLGSGPFGQTATLFGAGYLTAAFTGVPDISGLWFHFEAGVDTQPTGNFGPGFARVNPIGPGHIGGFGGVMRLRGIWVAAVMNGNSEPQSAWRNLAGRDLNTSSAMGGHTSMGLVMSQLLVTATGAPFFTGAVRMTNINTDLIHITTGDRAGFTGVRFTLHRTNNEMATQVTSMMGALTNELETFNVTMWGIKCTTSGVGTVTMISPVRVNTNGELGNKPSVITQTVRFVPEPGSLLLLGSGIVGLAVIGWRKGAGRAS